MGIYRVITSSGTFRLKSVKIVFSAIGRILAVFPRRPRDWDRSVLRSYKKILVIRPGGIGDAVFLLPILRRLVERGVQVDILCEERNVSVFRSQNVFKTYRYDHVREFIDIFDNSYDVIIDTEQWHYLSADIAARIRSKCLIGFASRPSRARFFDIPVEYDADGPELDNFTRLFAVLTAEATTPGLTGSFKVPAEFQSWASQQVRSPFVSLFIGASIPLRRFTREQIISIVRPILAKNIPVVLVGGADVALTAKEVVCAVNDERLFDFVGQISLGHSVALIEKSRLLVTPDSGLMHLACAVGTPVVAVFGPGQIKKWAPPEGNNSIVSLNLPCAPCTRFGYTNPTCHGKFSCMRDISIDQLNDLISKKLAVT